MVIYLADNVKLYFCSSLLIGTAFSSALNGLGSAGSFLQPLLVRAPGNDTTSEEIRGDIRTLMLIGKQLEIRGDSRTLILIAVPRLLELSHQVWRRNRSPW